MLHSHINFFQQNAEAKIIILPQELRDRQGWGFLRSCQFVSVIGLFKLVQVVK